jgi:pilus assembly protein FimV
MNSSVNDGRYPTGMRLRAIAAMLALAATPSHGLWLGEPLVRSRLGEPLRVDIPYRLEEGETIDDRCLGLGGAGAASADGLEFLVRGRTRLVEYGLERSILITTQQPQSEPVVKARLQVDCGAKVNLARDYVWLLDPPSANDAADRSNVPPLPPLAVETAAAALPAHG